MIRSTVIALASLLLVACSKTIDTTCTALQPITYSATGDTAETTTQIRQHNAAWKAICG